MRRNPIAYSRLFPLIAASVVCAVCATPVAVRTLSAELVRTQRVYAVSLHAYFGSVEKFAEAQVKVAEIRIDEITPQINRDFRTTGEQRTGRSSNSGRTAKDHLPVNLRCRQ